jgi:uncharacterized membrane protein (UPF0182 family)
MKELLEKWAGLENEECRRVGYYLIVPETDGHQFYVYGDYANDLSKSELGRIQMAVQEAIEARQTWAYHVDNIFRPNSGDSPCVMGHSAGVWPMDDGIITESSPYFEGHGDTAAEALLSAYLAALEVKA